jgi:hypothetical protein
MIDSIYNNLCLAICFVNVTELTNIAKGHWHAGNQCGSIIYEQGASHWPIAASPELAIPGFGRLSFL